MKPRARTESGIELTRVASAQIEPTELTQRIAYWYKKRDTKKIAAVCLAAFHDNPSAVANALSALTENEKKALLQTWKKDPDDAKKFLAGFFMPISELIKDKSFLGELNLLTYIKHGRQGFEKENLLYYFPFKEKWHHLLDAINVKLQIIDKPNSFVDLGGLSWSYHALNLSGIPKEHHLLALQTYKIGQDLSYLNLENSYLSLYLGSYDSPRATNFTYVNLNYATVDGLACYCDWSNVTAIGADLRGLNLGSSKIVNANFEGADLRNVNLTNTNLENANFKNADLRGAQVSTYGNENMVMRGANFLSAKMDYHLKGHIKVHVEGIFNEDEKYAPLKKYFSEWKGTHKSIFWRKSAPDEKYVAALYLLGATSATDFDERLKQIPKNILSSSFSHSFAKAANEFRMNLEKEIELRLTTTRRKAA